MRRFGIHSLPLWGRAGVGARATSCITASLQAAQAPIPTFPQRGKEEQP